MKKIRLKLMIDNGKSCLDYQIEEKNKKIITNSLAVTLDHFLYDSTKENDQKINENEMKSIFIKGIVLLYKAILEIKGVLKK